MENEITPEQKNQLKTWAGQRDAILLEISNLQTAKEKLVTSNKEIAEAYSDIEKNMNQVIGRIEELNKKEAELPLLISKEIASLESRKTCLETEIMNLAKLVEVLSTQKASLEKDVSSALATFTAVKDEAITLDGVVDHVVRVSKNNITIVDDLVKKLATSLEEIIEVNKKNVSETNVVIDKLPRMLVEIQKKGLINKKL
jgi:predicted  nucleic acid-binding Zn-ribbon protein